MSIKDELTGQCRLLRHPPTPQPLAELIRFIGRYLLGLSARCRDKACTPERHRGEDDGVSPVF